MSDVGGVSCDRVRPLNQRFMLVAIVSFLILGLSWFIYGWIGMNFVMGFQLFAVSFLVLLIMPYISRLVICRLKTKLGKVTVAIIVSLLMALTITIVTAYILVAQGVWGTTSGKFEISMIWTVYAGAILFSTATVIAMTYMFDITV